MTYKTVKEPFFFIDKNSFFENKKGKKTNRCLYAEAFPGDTLSMGPMTGHHATYRRCHDIAKDEPIIINAAIKMED